MGQSQGHPTMSPCKGIPQGHSTELIHDRMALTIHCVEGINRIHAAINKAWFEVRQGNAQLARGTEVS